MNKTNQNNDFSDLGIAPSLLGQLKKLGFEKPTPIQHQAIPIGIAGQDLMGIAQTGTGKTLAFSIPIIQLLEKHKGAALVLVPTRELATQVNQEITKLGGGFGLRTVTIIGGAPVGPQRKALNKKPHVIIATPGRLIDILENNQNLLTNIRALVLDEADRMLDMGFEPQIKKILDNIPKHKRQTMLFSATMPHKITQIANKYMDSPLRIEVAPAGTTVKNIEQEIFVVPSGKKLSLLVQLLSEYRERVLVFTRTKHGAKKITKAINNEGHRTAELHSNKSLHQRERALKNFKSGATRVLVATDIASRGIDVDDIEVVINYDLPDNSEDYVHRIGRTGRAGKGGKAISFAAPEQKRDINSIERLVQMQLPIKPLPEIEKDVEMPKVAREQSYRQRRYQKPKRNFQRHKSRNRYGRNQRRR